VGSKLTLGGRSPATGIAPSAGAAVARYWPAVALALLIPIWIIGLFGRGIWSPDEPREYDIAYNMLRSGDLVVPQLAGAPFVEKPPLAYWVQSASMGLFGPSIAPVVTVGILRPSCAKEFSRTPLASQEKSVHLMCVSPRCCARRAR
jgi:hypothetical protein